MAAVHPTASPPAAQGGLVLAATVFAVALSGAAVWWWVGQQAGDAALATSHAVPRVPELHLAVMIDITLLALALGALLGFGAAWLLRPLPPVPMPVVHPPARADAEQRTLAAIFDATTDYVVQTDPQGWLTYLNPAARRRLRIAPDEALQGRATAQFFPLPTLQRLREEIVPAALAGGVWVGETVACDADGCEFPVWHMVIAHRDAHGRVERFSGILRDISPEARARDALCASRQTLRELTDALPVQIVVVDRDERLRFTNTAYEHALRRSRAELSGGLLREVLDAHIYEEIELHVKRALNGERISFDRLRLVDDEPRWQELTYIPQHDAEGAVSGFLAMVQDITDRKREEMRLRRLVLMDPLTGLLNRSGFDQVLDELAGSPHGREGGAALLYVDLDRFKAVNDVHGHPAGDELLKIFARRLKNSVRPGDPVARLGGDEFAIVLLGLQDAGNAQRVAGKVVRAAEEPFWIDGRAIHVGASVGIALTKPGSPGWATLVERAGEMLYRAKADGRGRHAMAQGDA